MTARARPAQEPGTVVVHPRPGRGGRRRRSARLAIARRVAQVVEQDDRVRGKREVVDVRLAVVLDVVVAVAGGGVEPEAVLGRVLRIVGVRARPAVAVAHVDHDVRVGRGGLDLRPGRVRAVHLGDVRGVLLRLEVRGITALTVRVGLAVDGADDDHHLRVRDVRGRNTRDPDPEHGDERDEQGGDSLAQGELRMAGCRLDECPSASGHALARSIAGWSGLP